MLWLFLVDDDDEDCVCFELMAIVRLAAEGYWKDID